MIVQAVDGRYYQEPTFVGPNFLVRFQDGMHPQLVYKNARKGKLTSWKTARRVLRPAGFKAHSIVDSMVLGCKPENYASLMFAVIGDSFVECSVYELSLSGPIPVPTAYSAVLSDRPADGDFEIMDWV